MTRHDIRSTSDQQHIGGKFGEMTDLANGLFIPPFVEDFSLQGYMAPDFEL